MEKHANKKRVTFVKPFILKNIFGIQPAGTYSVETSKDNSGVFSFLKAKRTSTWIRISQNSGLAGYFKTFRIDPIDLKNALTQDGQPTLQTDTKLSANREE